MHHPRCKRPLLDPAGWPGRTPPPAAPWACYSANNWMCRIRLWGERGVRALTWPLGRSFWVWLLPADCGRPQIPWPGRAGGNYFDLAISHWEYGSQHRTTRGRGVHGKDKYPTPSPAAVSPLTQNSLDTNFYIFGIRENFFFFVFKLADSQKWLCRIRTSFHRK